MGIFKPHSYSQNNEQQIIADYFGDYKGQFLDIGANDGMTLSNTYYLSKHGWGGVLVEPSHKAFRKLRINHEYKHGIILFEVAIGDFTGEADFFESGEHLGERDVALLSTLKESELKRWEGSTNTFKKIRTNVWTFAELQKQVVAHGLNPQYQFISIDAEGYDLAILKQIDLRAVGCSCICIEHNSDKIAEHNMREYCGSYGLVREIGRNAENIILCI